MAEVDEPVPCKHCGVDDGFLICWNCSVIKSPDLKLSGLGHTVMIMCSLLAIGGRYSKGETCQSVQEKTT